MSDIKSLTEKIKQFRNERDWAQFHNHKDMALSLLLEAAELLEHFQWKSTQEVQSYAENHKEDIAEELADVAMYLFELADNLGVNLAESIEKKIQLNAQKYPIEKARGKHTKYSKL